MSHNIFKFAVSNLKNIQALRSTNIWSFPHGEFPYNLVSKIGKVGDKVIFTHQGSIVGIGEIVTMPSNSVTSIFPDDKAYTNSFALRLEKWGGISSEIRLGEGIKLRPGAISFGDKKTYSFAKNNLQYSN
jgi:hypothetical protein